MSTKRPHDADLMALADGELDENTSRELEDALARDAASRSKVDAIGELGDLLRGHLELSADEVPQKKLDALWREIDKGIDRHSASLRDAARSGAAGPFDLQKDHASSPVKVPVPVESVGFLRKVGRWFDRYRGHILTGAVSAGAVAALALLLRNPAPETGNGVAQGKAPLDTTLVNHQPAEIESLDTPDGTGTVFNLEDEDGNTTVIWVTPEDTVEGI